METEEEDARLMDRCEVKRTEWAKHWQCEENADELAKAGALLDEGFMAEVTAKTVQQERERERKVYGALQYAASFHCLVEEWRVVKS